MIPCVLSGAFEPRGALCRALLPLDLALASLCGLGGNSAELDLPRTRGRDSGLFAASPATNRGKARHLGGAPSRRSSFPAVLLAQGRPLPGVPPFRRAFPRFVAGAGWVRPDLLNERRTSDREVTGAREFDAKRADDAEAGSKGGGASNRRFS